MPGDPEVTNGVVVNLLDVDAGGRRRWARVQHPNEARDLPAEGLELAADRLSRGHDLEPDAPVREPGERLIREPHSSSAPIGASSSTRTTL